MRRAGHDAAEILAALQVVNANRCKPPMPADEVKQIAESVARYEPDQLTTALVERHADQLAAEGSRPITVNVATVERKPVHWLPLTCQRAPWSYCAQKGR